MHQVSTTSDPKCGTKVSLVAVQQAWNELITSVVCHCIDVSHHFMNLHAGIESSSQVVQPGVRCVYRVDEYMSTSDRIRTLFDGLNIVEILTQLTALNYRKACRLKLIKFKIKAGEDNENCNENNKESAALSDKPNDSKRIETR